MSEKFGSSEHSLSPRRSDDDLDDDEDELDDDLVDLDDEYDVDEDERPRPGHSRYED